MSTGITFGPSTKQTIGVRTGRRKTRKNGIGISSVGAGRGLEAMDLSEFIRPESIRLHVEADSKTVLLKRLSQLASEATGMPSATIMVAISEREKLGSTDIGGGAAIPHARLKGLQKTLALVAVLAEPCDFETSDGEPVDLLLLLLVPDHSLESDQRLLVGQAARRLSRAAFTQSIRCAASADAVHRLFASNDAPLNGARPAIR